jgi:hypothetical protein
MDVMMSVEENAEGAESLEPEFLNIISRISRCLE